MEAPWKEVSDEESSDGEMMVASSLAHCTPRWTSTEEDEGWDQWSGWQRKTAAKWREQATGRRRREEALEAMASASYSGACQGSMQILVPVVVPAVLDAGRYIVKAVQSQVTRQGPAGREIWLGVDLRRGGANITGWMHAEW